MTAREIQAHAERVESRLDRMDERRRRSLRHKGRIAKRAARQMAVAK